MQSIAKDYRIKARSKCGRHVKPKTIVAKIIRRPARPFVAVMFVLAMAITGWPMPASAQDPLRDRYQAIRQPGLSLADRTARQRLQAEVNAMERAQSRTRMAVRNTERLRFQDPVSRLAAQQQALHAELNRIDTDLRAAAAELGRLDRLANADPLVVHDLPGAITGEIPLPQLGAPGPGALPPEQAAAAARAFVDDLLRANRARP